MVTTRNKSARSEDSEIEPTAKRQKAKRSHRPASSIQTSTPDTSAKPVTARKTVAVASGDDMMANERPEDLATRAGQMEAGRDEQGAGNEVVANEQSEDLAAVADQIEIGGDERGINENHKLGYNMRSIQQIALQKFITLFEAAKSTYGDRTPFLKTGEKLEDDQVLVPIVAVTEAIRYRQSPQDPGSALENMFDITTSGRINLAKFGETNGTSSLRPGRPLLVPWIFNQAEQLVASGKVGLNTKMGQVGKEARKRDERSESHIFLLLIRMHLGLCEIRIFDSYPGLHFRKDSKIWPLVLQTIQKVVRTIAWIPGDDSTSITPDDHGYDAHFGPEVEVHVAHQGEDEEHTPWACGFNTILNAWTVAMNLLPNRHFNPSSHAASSFYERTAEMISLVMMGVADSNLLYAFLIGYGFALPSKTRQQCPSFPKLSEIHSIRDHASLTDYVAEIEPVEIAKRMTMGNGLQNGNATPSFRPQPRAPYRQASLGGHQSGSAASRTLIEPAVMANEIFSNPDAMSFWHRLNSSKRGRQYVDQQKFAPFSSIHSFIEFMVHNLRGKEAENMSHQEKLEWFEHQRYNFDMALSFDTDKLTPTPQSQNLQKAQLYCFRRLWAKEIVSLRERYWLMQTYTDALNVERKTQNQSHVSPTTQRQQHHHRHASHLERMEEDHTQESGSDQSRRGARKKAKAPPAVYVEGHGDDEDQFDDGREYEPEEHSEYED